MNYKKLTSRCLVLVAVLGAASAQAQPIVQTGVAVVFQDTQDTFLTPTPIVGSTATLTRYQDSIAARIDTNSLPPGAYTVWWVIFNNPAGCEGACGEDDLFRPEAQTAILWATGGIVEDDGAGHFRAMLRELEMSPIPGQVVFPGAGGLLTARHAEVHLIIKTHGEVREEMVGKQISTIFGGCTDPPGAVEHPVDPVETDRVFPCYDPQAVPFLAPNPADIPTACPTDPDAILSNQMSTLGLLERVAVRLGLRP